MRNLMGICLPVMMLVFSFAVKAQSIRSPYIFKVNQIVKNLSGFKKSVEICDEGLRDCAYDFILAQHRDYDPSDEYGEGFTTKIFEIYGTAKFPVGTLNRLAEIEIPKEALEIVRENDDLEAAYFDGHVYSESDSVDWIEPTMVRCAVFNDTRYNEYLYLCY